MIIDGKKIAQEIQLEIKKRIQSLSGRPPCLAVILAGQHGPSLIYVKRKMEACQAVGIRSVMCQLPEAILESELLSKVEQLNQDSAIDAILVQLPLPSHINPNKIIYAISPSKDVDGFHPFNIGKMVIGETDGFISCTPLGIKTLLERSSIDISGKQVLVIGRSNIVGKPLANLLIQPTPGGNATVTLAHRKTVNMKSLCRSADVIIVAIGSPKFITKEMVKEGTVVIDVGINKITDLSKKSGYQIVGDVDYKNVAPLCSYITPVPGGVGPMTIAMLMQNTLLAYERHFHE